MEFLDDVISDTALTEIGEADGLSVYVVVKNVLEIITGKFVDNKKTFPNTLSFLFFICQFAFLDFNVVLLGKPTQCFRIIHLFMFHDEMNGIAPFSACETFAESFGR